jgi:hypothetical protein
MRIWKSHRLTSHTWLGLNPQIGRPLSRIVGAIGLFFLYLSTNVSVPCIICSALKSKILELRRNFIKKKINLNYKALDKNIQDFLRINIFKRIMTNEQLYRKNIFWTFLLYALKKI